MIPGALGTALMLAGVLAGLSAAFGRHSPAAVIAIGIGAAFAALGGLLIAWFAASVAAGRIPHDDGESEALSLVCPACNDQPHRGGLPNRCKCAGQCGHPACVGDHTTVSADLAAELRALLDAEGGQS